MQKIKEGGCKKMSKRGEKQAVIKRISRAMAHAM